MPAIEIISASIGLILTLIVFSYLLKDNPLFRLAIYLFVGVSSGYAATVIVYDVLLPRLDVLQGLIATNEIDQLILAAIPLVLAVSLLAKLFPRMSRIGNFAMAVLVGVGAAAAVGGAVIGTLIPQSQAAINGFDPGSAGDLGARMLRLVQGSVMLVVTVFTLASFHFSSARQPDGTPKPNRLIAGAAWVGRFFIAVTLGVLFAGVYVAALTAMIERWSFVINFIRQLLIGI
jgi:hypothetical protein